MVRAELPPDVSREDEINPMNAACRKLGPDDECVLLAAEAEGGATAALGSEVDDALEEACQAAEGGPEAFPAFIAVLRQRGPKIRAALERMVALSRESENTEAEATAHRRSLTTALHQAGVEAKYVDLVEHAYRMNERAHATAHLLEDAEPLNGRALHHRSEGRLAQWMHCFARLVLWRVAHETVAPDSMCMRFAVTLAVDESRNAYAHYATGLEMQGDDAA